MTVSSHRWYVYMFENVHRKVKLIKYPLPQADPSSDPLIAITNIEVRILRDLHNWPDDHPPLPRWTSRLRRWRRSPASWSTWPTPPSWSCAGSFSSRTGSTLSSSSSASGASPTLAPGSTWWPWSSCPGWASSPCPSCTRTTRRQWTRLWAPWTPRWMKSRTRSCRSFPWTRIQQRKKSRLPVPVSHVHLKIKSTKSISDVQTATQELFYLCTLASLRGGSFHTANQKSLRITRVVSNTRKCQFSQTNPWIHLARTQLHYVYLSLLFGSASLLVLSVNLPDLYLVFHF